MSCQRTQKCCHTSKQDDIKQLKMDHLALSERVNQLEKLVRDMISYQPGGEGYQETKQHFESL